MVCVYAYYFIRFRRETPTTLCRNPLSNEVIFCAYLNTENAKNQEMGG